MTEGSGGPGCVWVWVGGGDNGDETTTAAEVSSKTNETLHCPRWPPPLRNKGSRRGGVWGWPPPPIELTATPSRPRRRPAGTSAPSRRGEGDTGEGVVLINVQRAIQTGKEWTQRRNKLAEVSPYDLWCRNRTMTTVTLSLLPKRIAKSHSSSAASSADRFSWKALL